MTDQVKTIQGWLVECGYNCGRPDGVAGKRTRVSVAQYQADNGIASNGEFTNEFVSRIRKDPKRIDESVYRWAANAIGCDVAAIKAVRDIEAGSSGFYRGKPLIKFERHRFYRKLKNKGINPELYRRDHPSIITGRSWSEKHTKSRQSDRWAVIQEASSIDRNAAIESTSWGLFQVMGENWKSAGFTSPVQFSKYMNASSKGHFGMLIHFVRKNRLAIALKDLDFARFAKGYNGSQYRKHKYDTRLMAAYKKYK